MTTSKKKAKNDSSETYVDEDGFVWNDDGDIIGIPKSLENEGEELFKITLRKVHNGEWEVKRP